MADGAVALAALAAAVAALVAAGMAWASARRDRRELSSREQIETVRALGEQVAATVERFHRRVAELESRLTAEQGEASVRLALSVAEQLRGVSAAVDERLTSSQRALVEGLAGATEVFGRVQGRLGQVTEIAARMERLAASVDDLGSILRAPKLRGLLGERTLEAVLAEVLPPRLWSAQHRFGDGRTVDAVVRLGDRLLPIDAKFPLEAYRRMQDAGDEAARVAARRELERAVKARIDEIASRYLRPDEGTLPIALMFVPAEGVWAEVVSGGRGGESLVDYGLERRVVTVSPASLYAYLTTVASALKGLEVEARAGEILAVLAALEADLGRFRGEFETVGRHLQHAGQRFAAAEARLAAVEARVARAGALESRDVD